MKRIFAAFMVIGAITLVSFGQRGQHTEGNTDQALRGSGRVNPSTLGMEIDIPLGSYPGRGINVPISLSYSSKLWRLNYTHDVQGPIATSGCRSINEAVYSENSASGWTSSLAVPYIEYIGRANLYTGEGYPIPTELCPNDPPQGYSIHYVRRLTIHLPSGESHELRSDDATHDDDPYLQANWNRTYYAVDGSNIKYVEDSTTNTYKLLMPDGSHYEFSGSLFGNNIRKAAKFTDRNGNFTSYNDTTGVWTDTLGRTFTAPIGQYAPASPTIQNYTMPGISVPYKFNWKQLKGASAEESGLTDFSHTLKYRGKYMYEITNGNWQKRDEGTYLFYSDEYAAYVLSGAEVFNPIVLAEIELPTGQKYKFSYDVLGRINKITYPTGGEEKFVYSSVATLSATLPNDISWQTNHGVTNRRVYETPGSTFYEWNYNVTYVAPSGYKVSTTSPDGTLNERFLHRGNDACQNCSGNFGFDNGLAGMPYKEMSFDSALQPVSMKLTHWTKKSFGNADWHPRVTHEETIAYDAGGSGDAVSATVKYEYEGDLNLRETPVLVNKTTQFAFVGLESGSPLLDPPCQPMPEGGGSCNPQPNPTPIPTPVPSSSPVKIVETTYLINDPNYAGVKSYYTAQNMMGLVTASQIKDGAGTVVSRGEMVYDESGRSPGYRGNPTTAKVWDSYKGGTYQAYSNPLTTSNSVSTSARFDAYGNQYESTDAKGNSTTTLFDSTHNAFPVTITSAVPDPTGTHGSTAPFVTTTTYNYTTGLPLTTTDANGQTTTIEYNDPLLRPTRVIAPNGHQTITEYGAGTSELTRWVKVRSQIDQTNWKEAYSWFDGLGRSYKTQSVDSAGDVFTESLFDEFGRPWKSSNPYRSGETKLWTENFYDTAGRVWKVKTPDNAEVETAWGLVTTGTHIGTVVTVTDQAEKQRRSITNALGQLTRVDEPNNAGQLGTVSTPNQPTLYAYDTLNNLIQVQQNGTNTEQCGGTITTCSQTRTFQYDSLSRLKQAVNPESGTINYTYDANGNLLTKIDALTITTTYTYDALNRVTQRAYTNEPSGSETPDVTYIYDDPLISNSKGKLTKVSSSISETRYTSFDILGRVSSSQQITDGQTYSLAYTYNLSGALIEQTYPSGRVVKNVLDNNGDLSIVQSKKSSNHGFWNYAENFNYAASGAVTSLQLGNGKWESTQFNSRLQPTQIALGTVQNGTDKLDLDFSYGTTANNGNVLSQTITVPTVGSYTGFTATQTYTYDSLNRIKDATENITGQTPPSWKQTFAYDRYGNRNFDQANTTQPATFADPDVTNPTINTTNNRFSSGQGYSYDSSGNTTQDALGRTFIYDAENKQIEVIENSVTIGEYFYDGDGKRVKKFVPNGETVIFVYDAAGKLVAEYANQISQTPKVSYLTSDHLGSPRINTDENGAVIARHDYHPFGEEIIGIGGRTTGLGYAADDVRKKFTGYERDGESGLDYAVARYHSSSVGRFQSPDPILLSRNRVRNPQIWNSYSYAGNNPLKFVDPFGLERIKLGDSEDKIKENIDLRKAEKKRLEAEKKQLKKDKASKDDIARKQGEIDGKNKNLKTLNKQLEGTQTINKMLAALDKVGERNGLQLSDFELTTDPSNDFSNLSASEQDRVAGAQAFTNVPNEGKTIFVNTALADGFYKLAQSNSDYTYYGASGLSHEKYHVTNPRRPHSEAFQRQVDVLKKFQNYYRSRPLYEQHLEEVQYGADGNIP